MACLGLEERHLGLTLSEVAGELARLADRWGVSPCGEGGEFETFTLDSPLHRVAVARAGPGKVVAAGAGASHLVLGELKLGPGRDREGITTQQLLGPALLSKLHPLQYCAPYHEKADWSDPPPAPLQPLTLAEGGERWTEEDGWWEGGGVAAPCLDTALAQLVSLLARHQASLAQAAKIWLYLDTMESYPAVNTAYLTHFGLNPPARVCVAVGEAGLPAGARVGVAAAGWREEPAPAPRHVHVQGWSHWAPANIGPYSQGVGAGERVLLSGMIGLVAGTMELLPGTAAQAGLALRHAARVAAAVRPGLSLARTSTARCYTVTADAAAQARAAWREECGEAEQCRVEYWQVTALPRTAAVEWELELDSS